MSSSRNRKKISTRKKKLNDDTHLETKKEVIITDDIVIPTFPELKADMDKIKEKIKEEKYDPTDKYMCEACSIYLLYKNVNRHVTTKCHIEKERHNN
jgi:hypothetical protein